MAFGSERSLLIQNPLKRALVRIVGDTHFGRVLRFQYLRQVIDRLPFTPRRILDAGCGLSSNTIFLAKRFPRAQVTGIDINQENLAEATRLCNLAGIQNLQFHRIDIQESLGDRQYDLIISWEALQYVLDDRRALTNFYTALRPAGLLLLHVMHAKGGYAKIGTRGLSPHSIHLDVGQVRLGYTESELYQHLREIGFERIDIQPVFGTPGMVAHSGFEVARYWPAPLYLCVFPFLVGLGYLDTRWPKSPGSGAILAQASRI